MTELDAGVEQAGMCPESAVLNPEWERRLHWRCRRGLLELDIVLGRFVRERYRLMSDEQRVILDELLDLPDTELWDLITGKKEPVQAHHCIVLKWINEV
jgi:antitoxin CptB